VEVGWTTVADLLSK